MNNTYETLLYKIVSDFKSKVGDKPKRVYTYKLQVPHIVCKSMTRLLKDLCKAVNAVDAEAVCSQIIGKDGKVLLLAKSIKVKLGK
jgi:hypothetical protein